jgi:hypothetical protein
MSKTKSTSAAATPAKRGRPKNPQGQKRFFWLGAHCTEAEKYDRQGAAARELPGKPFAAWLRSRIGLPEKPGT